MNETREIGREGDVDGKALSQRQNQHCLAMVLEVNRCKRKKAESQKHQLPRNTLGRRKVFTKGRRLGKRVRCNT